MTKSTEGDLNSVLKELKQVNEGVSKLLDVFENVEEGEEEENPKILSRLDVLETQNKEISEKLDKITAELRRLSYFKERLPPGLPVKYTRS